MDLEQRYGRRIRQILEDADLEVMTAKRVRRQLEKDFQMDLTHEKKKIELLTLSILNEVMNEGQEPNNEESQQRHEVQIEEMEVEMKNNQQDQKEKEKKTLARPSLSTKLPSKSSTISSEIVHDSSEDEAIDDHALALKLQQAENSTGRRTRQRASAAGTPTKRKRQATTTKRTGGGFTAPVALSESLAAFLGVTEMSRPQVVKSIWNYVKEKDLQDPSDRRFILVDERLSTIFPKARISSFEIAKYLAPHMKSLTKEKGTSPSAADNKKAKKVKSGESPARKRTSVFMRPLLLSPALSKLLGGITEMPRPTVVKKLWEYIKSHELQDPKDKRFILCDELLKSVMGRQSRVNAFKMNAYLTAHLYQKENGSEVLPESDEESNTEHGSVEGEQPDELETEERHQEKSARTFAKTEEIAYKELQEDNISNLDSSDESQDEKNYSITSFQEDRSMISSRESVGELRHVDEL